MYNNDNFEKLKKRIDKCRNCYIQGQQDLKRKGRYWG